MVTYTDYFLPGSIDHTGATDVRQAIGDWIAANVPDGADAAHHSRIRPYDASSVYLISSEAAVNVFSGFQLRGRRHITIDGGGSWSYWPTVTGTDGVADAASYAAFDPATDWVPGARIDLGTSGNNTRSAAFLQEECTDVRVTGWDMDGGNPNTGTTDQWDADYERSCAWYPRNGCVDVAFDNNRVDNWNGWAVFTTRDGVTLNVVPDGIAVHHNYIRGAEMGVAFVSGKHADVDYNIIVDTSWYPFDIEQEADADVVSDVRFHHNIVDRFAWYTPATCWTLSMAQAGDGTACVTDRITFEFNYIKQGPATVPAAYAVLGGCVANPTVLTTDPHTLSLGDPVWIAGADGGTPSPNGMHVVTGVPDDTHVALDFEATVGCGDSGTVALASNGDQPGQGGLAIGCYAANAKNDIVIRNNWSDDDSALAPGWRRSMYFDYVHNLTVTGNRQVISPPQTEFITDDDPTGTHILAPNVTEVLGDLVYRHIGDLELDSAGDPVTTSVLPVASREVVVGHAIVVGITYNADTAGNESAVDNLGNHYRFIEHALHAGYAESAAMLVAPVSVPGILTSITVTHTAARRRAMVAAEFVGVGALASVGGGDLFNGAAATWVDSKSIPPRGIAIGVVGIDDIGVTVTAGSASGTPSSAPILESCLARAGGGRGIGLLYAPSYLPGAALLGFSGTADASASAVLTAVGGVFEPAPGVSATLLEFAVSDPAGTDLTYLGSVIAGSFAQLEWSKPGSAKVILAADDPCAGLLIPGNLVSVLVDTVPRFVFPITEPESVTVADSPAGMTVTAAGKGLLSILKRGAVYPFVWPAEDVHYQSGALADNGAGGATTLVLDKPGTIVVGESVLIVAIVSVDRASNSVPAGWRNVGHEENNGLNLRIYAKPADSAAAGTVTFGFSATTKATGGMWAIACDANVSRWSVGFESDSGTTIHTPSVDASVTGGRIFALCASSVSTTVTPNVRYAEHGDSGNTGRTLEASMTTDVVGPGNSPVRSHVAANTGDWIGASIFLPPPDPTVRRMIGTPGQILDTLIAEAEARDDYGALAGMTIQRPADPTIDSNGDAWPTAYTLPFAVGTDLLAVWDQLVALGMQGEMVPGSSGPSTATLRVYGSDPDTAHKEGSAIFRAGHNITGDVTRTGHGSNRLTRTLVVGESGLVVEVAPYVVEEADLHIGRREGGMSFASDDYGTLADAGMVALIQSALEGEGLTLAVAHGATSAGHVEPFADYGPGDWIGLDDAGDVEAQRVMRMTLALRDDGDFAIDLDLNSVDLEEGIQLGIELDRMTAAAAR